LQKQVPPEPPKNKKPAGAIGASGLIRAFCYESATQTSTGAAGSRDDDGVDAPEDSLQVENTRSGRVEPNQKSRQMHLKFRY
jgi:hypothetical protein